MRTIKNFNLTNQLLKIVRFIYGVFIVCDILILIRAALKNYGEKLELNNIIKTIAIFATLTIILFLIKRYLEKINKLPHN